MRQFQNRLIQPELVHDMYAPDATARLPRPLHIRRLARRALGTENPVATETSGDIPKRCGITESQHLRRVSLETISSLVSRSSSGSSQAMDDMLPNGPRPVDSPCPPPHHFESLSCSLREHPVSPRPRRSSLCPVRCTPTISGSRGPSMPPSACKVRY